MQAYIQAVLQIHWAKLQAKWIIKTFDSVVTFHIELL